MYQNVTFCFLDKQSFGDYFISMVAVKGYIKNNEFVSDNGFSIPDGSRVVVAVLEPQPSLQGEGVPEDLLHGSPLNEASSPQESNSAFSETERQRRAWADFFEAMENDPEELSPEFDEIISKGIKFRYVDFS
jgi:hypothetical protein